MLENRLFYIINNTQREKLNSLEIDVQYNYPHNLRIPTTSYD